MTEKITREEIEEIRKHGCRDFDTIEALCTLALQAEAMQQGPTVAMVNAGAEAFGKALTVAHSPADQNVQNAICASHIYREMVKAFLSSLPEPRR